MIMRRFVRHSVGEWAAIVLGLVLAWMVAAFAAIDSDSGGLTENNRPDSLDVPMWAATAALLGFVAAAFAGQRSRAIIVACYLITLFAGIAAVVLRSTG